MSYIIHQLLYYYIPKTTPKAGRANIIYHYRNARIIRYKYYVYINADARLYTLSSAGGFILEKGCDRKLY